MALRVEVVSPERISYSGDAKMVIARVAEGDIAFLPGHVPFIGTLQTHPVRVLLDDGGEVTVAVHEGFVQVSGDTVTILSDICEMAGDIDVARAESARARATEALKLDAADEAAAAALKRAEVRLEVATGKTAAGAH